MSNTNTGGPAFPVPLNPGQSWQGMTPCDGMTLRDYFAAKVIQGLLANHSGPIQQDSMNGWGWCNCTVGSVAEFAWRIADAMLKARDNQE